MFTQTHKTPFVLAMIGLVGSGKSYVAERIAALTHAEIVRGDSIRVSLGAFTQEQIRAEMVKRVHALISAGTSVILDSDFINLVKRTNLTEIARTLEVDVYFIRVYADIDIIIGRAIAAQYDGGPADVFSRTATRLMGTAQERGQVVKIREMIRRIPLHYSWSEDDAGGTWTHHPLPTEYIGKGVIADIDTTDSQTVDAAINEVARIVSGIGL